MHILLGSGPTWSLGERSNEGSILTEAFRVLELKVCTTMPGKSRPQDGPPLSAEVVKRDAANGVDVRLQQEGAGAWRFPGPEEQPPVTAARLLQKTKRWP